MKNNTFDKPRLFLAAILYVLAYTTTSFGIEMTCDELISIINSEADDVPPRNSFFSILTFFPKYVARFEVPDTGQKIKIQGTSKFMRQEKFLVNSATSPKGQTIHTVTMFDPQENAFIKWAVMPSVKNKVRRSIGITLDGSRSISWLSIDNAAGTYALMQQANFPQSTQTLEHSYKGGQLVQQVNGTIVSPKP